VWDEKTAEYLAEPTAAVWVGSSAVGSGPQKAGALAEPWAGLRAVR
jgi:hypothetical protein